ncbi:MAG: AbrB family transcriptional regulator [Acidobacteria bacterium]|nr:MAG: AbrB family transcriptional regulator [Acidobacteriota bacterium]
MDVAAKLTSKGQVTIPKPVRDALELAEGDAVVFRIEGKTATMARTPNLLDLAGSIDVPASRRSERWGEVRRASRKTRSAKRR